MDRIQDNLFLGDAMAANSSKILENAGITHILNVTDIVPCKFPKRFQYKQIRVPDAEKTDLRRRFEDCFNFIYSGTKDNNKVLVHCYAGMSRSATIVIAFIMKEHKIKFGEAFKFVRQKRPFI
mmetsp:Transcript_9312/g.6683  ORF Transcript_9312/g.6683 Transcript_9312/m.6683 type:complete len:123 (+) Transcript_9312:10-378(+)